MPESTFDRLSSVQAASGPQATLSWLADTFRSEKNYHKLFDVLLMKRRQEMGLPLVRPSSLDDIPDARREEFENAYIAAAREVGGLFLADGNIPDAWVYLRTIREPQRIREAIDALSYPRDAERITEEIIQIALHEGANPVKGLELLLRSHGTCNTVTTLDQMLHTMTPADRTRGAALLANHLYGELSHNVRSEVQKRIPMLPPNEPLRSLIAGRDWLFGEGNYHIDVSHLNAVVRFCRFLEPTSPELGVAIQLAEYGSRLNAQFQYGGDAPFDDFYPAHVQFFKALKGENRDQALAYFQGKLDAEPDEEDKPLLAYVLCDLLIRTGKKAEAVEIAAKYLANVDESTGFSFARLCQEAGRLDALRDAARERGDLVTYTAALLESGRAVP